MLTAEGRRDENERLIAAACKEGKSDDEIGTMRIYLNVKPQYLESTLHKENELYGSYDNYIQEGIGISKETIKNTLPLSCLKIWIIDS